MTASVTAHAGLDVLAASRRRNPRTEPGPFGTADRAAGEAVCAEPSEFGEPPAALWETVITCASCAVLVRAWGIELAGCSL